MKTTIVRIGLLLLTIIIFSSCSQINMTDQEAQALIVKTLNLPQNFRVAIDTRNYERCSTMEREGYITVMGQGMWVAADHHLSVTEKGRIYYLGEGEKTWLMSNTLLFRTFDIDFDRIGGIAINKEQQTATVRFSLKAINITPVGRLLLNNIDNPKNGELVFKKFDTGWQLASGQNKSGSELVREIVSPIGN